MLRRSIQLTLMVLLLLSTAILHSCAYRPQTAAPAVSLPSPGTDMQPSPVQTPGEFTVFYDSDPPGAILYDTSNNTKLGETPFWAMYELTEKDRRHGFISIDPSRVVWQSGATATNHPGLIYPLKDGLQKTYLFSRPDVKGSEEDYAYGLKRLMQRYTYGEDSSRPNTGK